MREQRPVPPPEPHSRSWARQLLISETCLPPQRPPLTPELAGRRSAPTPPQPWRPPLGGPALPSRPWAMRQDEADWTSYQKTGFDLFGTFSSRRF